MVTGLLHRSCLWSVLAEQDLEFQSRVGRRNQLGRDQFRWQTRNQASNTNRLDKQTVLWRTQKWYPLCWLLQDKGILLDRLFAGRRCTWPKWKFV